MAPRVEVELLCARALEAWPIWAQATAAHREGVLLRSAMLLEANAADLAGLLCRETGATPAKADAELRHTVSMLRSVAGECRRLFGQVLPADLPGTLSLTLRRPKGLVVAISPFNMPIMLSLKKAALALAAGNAVIVKPAPEAAASVTAAIAVFEQAGAPPGLLGLLHGGAEPARTLIRDARVRHVSFTGSTAAGHEVRKICAELGKTCSLELGGKSPLIVLADADIDYAASCAVFGLFTHSGQACTASSRIIVEAPMYDRFLAVFLSKARKVRAGASDQPGVMVGPLNRVSQASFIQERVERSVAAGARLELGGCHSGALYQPTVLSDVTPSMPVFREELFGPVAAVVRAEDRAAALRLANDSAYGLSAAVHTRDLGSAMAFIQGLEAGMIHVNGMTAGDEPHAPYGGLKESGMGREGGRWGLEELTDLIWVTLQGSQRPFPF